MKITPVVAVAIAFMLMVVAVGCGGKLAPDTPTGPTMHFQGGDLTESEVRTSIDTALQRSDALVRAAERGKICGVSRLRYSTC